MFFWNLVSVVGPSLMVLGDRTEAPYRPYEASIMHFAAVLNELCYKAIGWVAAVSLPPPPFPPFGSLDMT